MTGFYDEPYRPQIHFSPRRGWMNDPNGMVYFDGEYHLFYQFTPDQIDIPGPKHWGHAISKDLVHWNHLPVALSPDKLGEIWSGSVAVDSENSSGFQSGDVEVLVAVFTHYDHGLQHQSLAYSNDRGRSWFKYKNNPVIPNPGYNDFRDPKVIWHKETNRWVMVLAAGDRVIFYTSPNLVEWELASDFGALDGAHGGVWECPDLFPVTIYGNPKEVYWVLLVSVGSGAPAGGSGAQYFLGTFDGKDFVNHNPASDTNWLDYGRDNYAGVTFSGLGDRRILMGWMSNWHYAYQVPTKPWKGSMTLPRELSLIEQDGDSLRLLSKPIPELLTLRGKHTNILNRKLLPDESVSVLKNLDGAPFEIDVDISITTAPKILIKLLNLGGDYALLGYDVQEEKLYIDRSDAGLKGFEPSFGQHIHSAPLPLTNSRIQLNVFLDRSSIEVFADEGAVVLTDLLFTEKRINEIVINTINGEAIINSLNTWVLSKIW
jgi:fructan beta-fructosidase